METAEQLILIRYGEIALKSNATRRRFEEKLLRNIRHALQKHGIQHKLQHEWGRIYLCPNDIAEATQVLQTIFGIVSFSHATKYEIDDLALLSQRVAEYCEKLLNDKKSFAVRATRTGTHSFTSQDVAIKTGDAIRKTTGASVNLDDPDMEVFIEVRENTAFVFTEKINGPGGLPLGTQGRLAIIIENPYSILAAWLLMKRGCDPLFILVNNEIEALLQTVMKKWNVSLNKRVVNCTAEKKKDGADEELGVLVDIARNHNCDAVATGEHLKDKGQKLWSTKSEQSFLFLHPLISFEEQEIRQKCAEIGVL